MKKLVLILVILICLNSLVGQEFFGEIPVGFEKEFVGGRMPWHITGKTNNGIISIFVYDDTREILVSENEKYLFVTSGTDVVGGIEFYDIINRKYLVWNSYAGEKPQWKKNKVKYEKVELVGDGFSIRRTVVFSNGKIIHGKQYIGGYHALSDNEVPFNSDYSIAEYASLAEASEYFIVKMEQIGNNYPDFEEKINLAIKNKMSTKDEILENANCIINIIEILMSAYFNEEEAANVFSYFYIVLDKAHSEKILSSDQLNSELRKMLKVLNIEDQTAKKLFKY
jgi:hypothetical protein